jgi:hypothetical protein
VSKWTLLTISFVAMATDKTDINLPETAFEKKVLEYAKSQSQNNY